MSFTTFFIRRPGFTIVCISILTLLGLISFNTLPIRWLPSIAPPVLSVFTGLPGASPKLIENQITIPLESSLSGIDGVESVSSNSSQGESSINLTFKLGKNLSFAMEDVRNSVAREAAILPRDASAPMVVKASTDDIPILFLAFSNPRVNEKETSDYVEQFIIPSLQNEEGVANVLTFARRASALKIWLDPLKMSAAHVTIDDIKEALQSQNIELPAGQVMTGQRYYNLVINEKLNSVDDFKNVMVRKENKQIVKLGSVAKVEIAPLETNSAFRVNGQPALALGIIPQSNANPLAVAQNILKKFAELKKTLPQGMQASVVYNQAKFISSSVKSVYEALFEAIACVLLVVFLFLGNFRATLVPLVTIPVCLISSFILFQIFGFSINTITLMAFVLAIGLVVDDAIVMVENISRHIESGMTVFAASVKGSREIIFPIIAMTLTLAAVYTPIAFIPGVLNAIFREFAITLAGSVIISGVVALTLSPMMCAILLKQKSLTHRNKNQDNFLRLQSGYRQILLRLFKFKRRVYFILFIASCLGGYVFHSLSSELAPTEDRNEINVYLSAPQSATFDFTNGYVKKLEAIYKNIPDIKSYITQISEGSTTFAYNILNLKPKAQRTMSIEAIADEINNQGQDLVGVDVHAAIPPPPLAWFSNDGQGNSLSLGLISTGSYEDLYTKMNELIEHAKGTPYFSNLISRLKWDRDQLNVEMDRNKIADLNLSLINISNTLSTFVAGRNAGKFSYGGKQYDVMLKLDESYLKNPNFLSLLSVRNSENQMISLADFTQMKESTDLNYLPHYNRSRVNTLYASLNPGYTVKDGIDALQQIARDSLPDNMKIIFMGEAKTYLEANLKIFVTFLLALVFIYLLLVAQFESFIDPLIILTTVPFALIGGLVALKLSGCTLNIYSNIGLMTLIGLIAKHGILITEFANEERRKGHEIIDAVLTAAQLRLRPVLMTTAAMVLGALPLALSSGAGAETREQIGWVIVGGMCVGTFFSLVVVPLAYLFFAPFKKYPRIDHVSVDSEAQLT